MSWSMAIMTSTQITEESQTKELQSVNLKLPPLSPENPSDPLTKSPVDLWHSPAVIAENNFVYKSLSNWSFNVAVGCSHACRFCYVPSVTTIKLGTKLSKYAVKDPDAEWGDYVLLRPWNEEKFLASLRAAEGTPRKDLKPDGNRAVIYCSTTDPYQVIRHPDPVRKRELAGHARFLVRRSLELIRDHSTLNVRMLTRSPLARTDFELFRTFGKRLVFGMSLPTLRNDLAKIYEPRAPAPSQRLSALRAAKEAGLHVFVALAPTYPECDESDIRSTLTAVAELDPITVFHEPINIRAENVARIAKHAHSLGFSSTSESGAVGSNKRMRTEVFATRETWQDYAVSALHMVHKLAHEVGLGNQIHLWPDKSLGQQSSLRRMPDPDKYLQYLERCWHRISEWPT
jgi:DNA repair photolyase